MVELIAWRLGPHRLTVKQGHFQDKAASERKTSAQIPRLSRVAWSTPAAGRTLMSIAGAAKEDRILSRFFELLKTQESAKSRLTGTYLECEIFHRRSAVGGSGFGRRFCIYSHGSTLERGSSEKNGRSKLGCKAGAREHVIRITFTGWMGMSSLRRPNGMYLEREIFHLPNEIPVTAPSLFLVANHSRRKRSPARNPLSR